MSTRRELLLDAAIDLLGAGGVHAMTHRAVDARAGVGAGSTANYFGTRQALLEAVVDRFAARERANFEEVAVAVAPTTVASLGQAFGAFARDEVGKDRTLTLCRYALLVESANNAELRARMAAGGARVSAWFGNWLRLIGSVDPAHDVHVLGNYLTGLVLHQLAMQDPAFDPTDKITELLESLIAAGVGRLPAPTSGGTDGR